jgi:superfamily I DNA/RNA helicase
VPRPHSLNISALTNDDPMEKTSRVSREHGGYNSVVFLLYVACTRARDRLLVSGVQPASEFLNDLK